VRTREKSLPLLRALWVEYGALLMECRVLGAKREGSERVCVCARESPPLARDLLVERGDL